MAAETGQSGTDYTNWKAPDGALAGQFCRSQWETKENPDGTDCTAHLAEGRIFQCPFESPTHAETGINAEGDFTRVCPDFEPRDYGPDRDYKLKIGIGPKPSN